MTTTGRVFLVAAAVFYLIAAVNQQQLNYVMCWVTMGVLVAAWLVARMSLSGITVDLLDHTGRVFEGSPASLRVRFRNVGSLNKTSVTVTTTLRNEVQGTTRTERWHLPCLEAGEEAAEALRFTGLRRGVLPLETLTLTSGDPLGLFRRTRRVPLNTRLLVCPQRLALPPTPATSAAQGTSQALRELRRQVGEEEFYGVRPFVDGDDLRRVHWPTTARTGRLALKEFHAAAQGESVLVVDLWQGSTEAPTPRTDLEASLKVAGALVEQLLSGGCALRMCLTARPVVNLPPDRGDRQRVRALECLARAQANGPQPLGAALLRGLTDLPEGGTLFCVTSRASADLAAAVAVLRARQLHATFVVATSLPGGATVRERPAGDAARTVRLAGAEVICLGVPVRGDAGDGG